MAAVAAHAELAHGFAAGGAFDGGVGEDCEDCGGEDEEDEGDDEEREETELICAQCDDRRGDRRTDDGEDGDEAEQAATDICYGVAREESELCFEDYIRGAAAEPLWWPGPGMVHGNATVVVELGVACALS